MQAAIHYLTTDLHANVLRRKGGAVATVMMSTVAYVHAVLYLEENLALYERLSLRRFCEKMAGKSITTRSNVLLVRQSRLTRGTGVLLSYHSEKNTKKIHHGGQ